MEDKSVGGRKRKVLNEGKGTQEWKREETEGDMKREGKKRSRKTR